MPDLPDLPQTEIAIVALTNAFRQENKLGAVTPNKELAAAAQWFAEYLARTDKFAHEADGREPQQRASAHGYKYCMVAENLARNLDSRGYTAQRLAAEVVEGWKNSPPHRQNLVETDATEIGVSVVRAPDKHPKFVSVQMFGRPETLKVTFSVTNTAQLPVSYTLGREAHVVEPKTIVTHEYCASGRISFDRAGNWLSGSSIGVTFEPQNGVSFTLRQATGSRVVVEAGAARTK
ncbi:MAG: CAP domain-containing protein [Hyphomicrobiaceae bacterium]